MNALNDHQLAQSWADIWNGNLKLVDEVIGEDFTSHAAPLLGGAAGDSGGPQALKQWVAGIHSLFKDLTFTLNLGPIVKDPYFILRWRARGTYSGGIQGTDSAIGNVITFFGTDTLRIADGRIREYWANADSLWFVQQLGLKEVPPLT